MQQSVEALTLRGLRERVHTVRRRDYTPDFARDKRHFGEGCCRLPILLPPRGWLKRGLSPISKLKVRSNRFRRLLKRSIPINL
jgi:hypothetical protein